MKKFVKKKCNLCGHFFYLGWNGTEEGCDKCTHTVRDENGYSWSPDEKHHDYMDVASGATFRVSRHTALNPSPPMNSVS